MLVNLKGDSHDARLTNSRVVDRDFVHRDIISKGLIVFRKVVRHDS